MAKPAGGGRLDRAPDSADLVAWPDDLGTRFALFIDTEEEFDWDDRSSWNGERTDSVRAIPAANRRLCDGGAKPVYLVDHPIAADPRAVEILRELTGEQCEIGAQLHPWNTPPVIEPPTVANSFVGNLERDLERKKIETLRQTIDVAFGAAPQSFRAGRYGVGMNTADLLEDAGFALDVSSRPLFDYRAEGGPDFSGMPVAAFWAGARRQLLALPLSATRIGSLARIGAITRLSERSAVVRSLLSRTGLSSRVALTPEGMPIAEAEEAVRMLLGEGIPILSFSFHSPSLEPGNTPYVRDEDDLALFWEWWTRMFALLAREGVSAIDGSGIVEAAWRARGGRPDVLATTDKPPLSADDRAGPVAQW